MSMILGAEVNSVDFKVMIHKIHAGASLDNDYGIYGFRNSLHDYSNVNFTAGLDDCTICHTGEGEDVANWSGVPTIEACGSCHDDVDFVAGTNHEGGAFDDNAPWVRSAFRDYETAEGSPRLGFRVARTYD